MNRLHLHSADRETIRLHAEASYPEECCGFLIGTTEGEATRVERAVAAGNEREESRHNRFLISPENVLAAHKEARRAGLDVVGYYHSHPDHPARPSEFDREHAWPGMSYLIVSIEKGRQVDARSWRLSDDRAAFAEEQLDEPESAPENVHKETEP
jgi:proteasome lid subunit RPN8/RPN11